MNCFDCKIPCEYSNPLGYCYKEQSELPQESNPTDGIKRAASDLVDAVERYVNPKRGQFCHRSELLIIKDKLKGLLK